MKSLQLLIVDDVHIPDPHSAIPPINIKALEITSAQHVVQIELHSKFPSLQYLFIHDPIIKGDNLAILFESLTHLPHLVTLGIHTDGNAFPTTPNFDHLYAQLENIYFYRSYGSPMLDGAILSKLTNLKQLAIAGDVKCGHLIRLVQTIPKFKVDVLVIDTYRKHNQSYDN